MNTETIEQYLARGGVVTQLPGPQFKPYLESKRKPDPDIAARQKRHRVRALTTSGVPIKYVGMVKTMRLLGYEGTGKETRAFFLSQIDKGLVPPPDYVDPRKEGRIARGWLPETIENFIAAQKAILIRIVDRHA